MRNMDTVFLSAGGTRTIRIRLNGSIETETELPKG